MIDAHEVSAAKNIVRALRKRAGDMIATVGEYNDPARTARSEIIRTLAALADEIEKAPDGKGRE